MSTAGRRSGAELDPLIGGSEPEERPDPFSRRREVAATSARSLLMTVLGEVVLPYLHELGSRWERGDATIAHEHFASTVLRGRLLGGGLGGGVVDGRERAGVSESGQENLSTGAHAR